MMRVITANDQKGLNRMYNLNVDVRNLANEILCIVHHQNAKFVSRSYIENEIQISEKNGQFC